MIVLRIRSHIYIVTSYTNSFYIFFYKMIHFSIIRFADSLNL